MIARLSIPHAHLGMGGGRHLAFASVNIGTESPVLKRSEGRQLARGSVASQWPESTLQSSQFGCPRLPTLFAVMYSWNPEWSLELGLLTSPI